MTPLVQLSGERCVKGRMAMSAAAAIALYAVAPRVPTSVLP